MKNIKDYMNELAKYDFAENFGDYGGGYICDVISEIADDDISIYTQDQINYAMEHDDAVEEAFANGIAPDGNDWFKQNGNDFRGYVAAVGVAAWYENNVQTMYKNMEECVLYAVLAAIKDQYGVEELTDDQVSDLESLVEFDNNDRIEDVIDNAVEVLGLNDEDEED